MQTKACKVSSNGEHTYVPMSKETRVFDNETGKSCDLMKHSTEPTPRQTIEETTTAVYCRRCGDTQELRPAPAVWVQNEVETGLPIRLGGPRDHGHLNEPAD